MGDIVPTPTSMLSKFPAKYVEDTMFSHAASKSRKVEFRALCTRPWLRAPLQLNHEAQRKFDASDPDPLSVQPHARPSTGAARSGWKRWASPVHRVGDSFEDSEFQCSGSSSQQDN